MAITMTESAAERINGYLADRGKGIGLRLSLRKTGCSGMAYVVDFADDLEENEQVFEDHGVKVIVNQENMAYLDGIEMDFVRDGLNQMFTFNNPNAKSECGCGESFSV